MITDERTIERFTRYMEKYPGLYRALAVMVRENMPYPLGIPLIVDLGSGPGFLSVEIQKLIPESQVIDLDPSVKMLEMAQKHTFKDISKKSRIILSASENIPLKGDSVDIIVSRFSMPYWEKPEDSFAEMFRILKPGGRVILENLNKVFPKWKLFLIKLHMFTNLAGRDVIRYHADAYEIAYAVEQVEHLLTDAKFTIIKKEGDKKDWKFIVVAEKPID